MKLLRCASLALALAVTARASAADEDFKYSAYYPMQVGATWNYKAGDSKFTLKVTEHKKIGTRLCAHVQTIQDGKPVGSEDVSVQDDGVYRVASDDKNIEPPVLILRLQKDAPTKNDAWNVNSRAETKSGEKQTLQGTFTENDGEKVTAAGKEYTAAVVSCEDLDANGAKYSFRTYYAKDVGMVKQEISAGALKVTIELEAYEPGK
jgi:hypothetical protein